MTLIALGELSVGAAVPGCTQAVVAGSLGITRAVADLQARLDALANFRPLPVTFSAQLALATSVVTSIQAAITAGFTPPDIATQIAHVQALVAQLTAQLTPINANLAILTALKAPLATAGVAVYVFDGAASALAAELDAALGTGPGHANAVIMIAHAPEVWAALSAVVQVTP